MKNIIIKAILKLVLMTTSFSEKILSLINLKNTIFLLTISLLGPLKSVLREIVLNMMKMIPILWSKQILAILMQWIWTSPCTIVMSLSILSIESLPPLVTVTRKILMNQIYSLLAVIGSLLLKRKEKKKGKNSFKRKTFRLFLMKKTIMILNR